MEHEAYIANVIIILFSAVFVVSLFRALNVNSVVGYLIAGLLIGPHALAFITDVETIELLGEFGVVFLLFTIGLKMPMRRFQVLRRYVFGLGLMQVVVTISVVSLIAYFFSYAPASALLIGSALALSSTAVGLQLLSEQGDLAQKYGRVSFAVLLFQDLAVVVLLVLLTTISTPEQDLFEALSAAGLKAAVVLILIVLFGQLILRPVFRIVASQKAEIFTAVSILIVLLTSLATDAAGLSKELGAFLAGLLLSETEYRHQVEADIQPFYGLLLGLFFMTVGMNIDVHGIVNQAREIFMLLGAMLLVKAIILFGLCKAFKIATGSALRAAFLLAAGGEFAFVVLGPAVDQKLVSSSTAQVIYLSVAISMALTPFLATFGKWLSERLDLKEGDSKLASSQDEIDDLRNHVIVAGFGRIGKMICRLLADRMIPFVAIDNNMNRVLEGRARGLPIYYGDATRDVVWKSLGAEKASSAVVSLALPKTTLRASLMVRRKFPNINVSVRINDDAYVAKLTQAGAVVVKPENFEPSLQLASSVLKDVGTNDAEVSQIIESFRRSYAGQEDPEKPDLQKPA
ncbi:MAG TPA: potassium transporter KefB [Holosporales bacterium]|nr:potassium transporter KefB [Holosporales bacterium]